MCGRTLPPPWSQPHTLQSNVLSGTMRSRYSLSSPATSLRCPRKHSKMNCSHAATACAAKPVRLGLLLRIATRAAALAVSRARDNIADIVAEQRSRGDEPPPLVLFSPASTMLEEAPSGDLNAYRRRYAQDHFLADSILVHDLFFAGVGGTRRARRANSTTRAASQRAVVATARRPSSSRSAGSTAAGRTVARADAEYDACELNEEWSAYYGEEVWMCCPAAVRHARPQGTGGTSGAHAPPRIARAVT